MFTTIYGKDSEESKLWEEFSKRYVSPQKQRGYDWMMNNIIPIVIYNFKLNNNGNVLEYIKSMYTKPLIAFMKFRLKQTMEHPEPIEMALAKSFICLCEDIGFCLHNEGEAK